MLHSCPTSLSFAALSSIPSSTHAYDAMGEILRDSESTRPGFCMQGAYNLIGRQIIEEEMQGSVY